MAKKTIEKFYSDLSEKEITGDHKPVSFAFEGSAYEIDLTSAERADFEKSVQRYIDAARPARRSTNASRGANSKHDPKAIRAWASENNVDVPARGRIPATVVQAYLDATR